MRGNLLYVFIPVSIVVIAIAVIIWQKMGLGLPEFLVHPTIATYFVIMVFVIFLIFLVVRIGDSRFAPMPKSKA